MKVNKVNIYDHGLRKRAKASVKSARKRRGSIIVSYFGANYRKLPQIGAIPLQITATPVQFFALQVQLFAIQYALVQSRGIRDGPKSKVEGAPPSVCAP